MRKRPANAAIFEHMREGMCGCDGDFRVQAWNRAAEGLTGFSREEVLARPIEEILGAEASLQLRACPGHSQGQGAIPVKGGGAVSVQLTHLLTPEGAVQLFFPQHPGPSGGSSVDVSGLISAVAHDLRNPVGSILGFAKLLLHPGYGELPPRKLDFVRNIRESAEQMSRSLGNVALANSLDNPALGLAPTLEVFPLSDLLDPLIEDFAGQAQRKGVVLESPSDLSGTIRGDLNLMRQALYNLLSNALRHTEKGGVQLLAQRSGENVRLVVVNSGRPIPPAELPGLLRKHARVAGHKRGLGLGLYVTRAIVEAHGSRLEIESGPQTTSFAFQLECPGPGVAPPGEGQGEPARPLTPPLKGGTLRLLVAGGTPTDDLIRRMEGLGHEVSRTPWGMEALNLALRNRPQALCCHASLMDMTPDDLVAALRENPNTAQIPVVVLGPGADPALSKTLALAALPTDVADLLARLSTSE